MYLQRKLIVVIESMMSMVGGWWSGIYSVAAVWGEVGEMACFQYCSPSYEERSLVRSIGCSTPWQHIGKLDWADIKQRGSIKTKVLCNHVHNLWTEGDQIKRLLPKSRQWQPHIRPSEVDEYSPIYDKEWWTRRVQLKSAHISNGSIGHRMQAEDFGY